MSCAGHHHPIWNNAAKRADPTHTGGVRRSFEREFISRFAELRRRIRDYIERDDVLGLSENNPSAASRLFANRFVFREVQQKREQFMSWVREQQADLGLTVLHDVDAPDGGPEWMRSYIQNAYQRGIVQSGAELRRAGAKVAPRWVEAALSRPVHADRASKVYARAYRDLRGITAAMDRALSEVISAGMARGDNPAEISRAIRGRVNAVGRTRSIALARTEVIAAHAEATLSGFQEAGLSGVVVVAEWLTAAGACPECLALAAAGPYEIEQARGLIPVHPNCRCAWAPEVVGGSGIELA